MLKPRDLPRLAAFAAVVRSGTFTGAARELGLPKSVVSESVKALEAACGVRLLERSTRRLHLTAAGAAALASARTIEASLRDLDAALDRERDAPAGTLRIATTHDLAPRLVAPAAALLGARHAGLRVEVVADDAPRDLIAAGVDAAVRLGAPRDSSYTLRRLATIDEPIVAAPALAERYAHAVRPRDLAGAPWARHTLLSGEAMTFLGPRGQTDEIAVSLRAEANTGQAVLGLLIGGVGLGALPEYLLEDALARGALVRVCPAWVWKRVLLYALVPSSKHPRSSVTAFLAVLKDLLHERPVSR